MTGRGVLRWRGGTLLLCMLAGWAHAAALAWPFRWTVTPWLRTGEPVALLHALAIAVLVATVVRMDRLREVLCAAAVFATAWLAGSFWWLFISMHTYGGLAAPLAALAVLALAAFLALDYVAAVALWWRWRPQAAGGAAVAFASAWTLAELARGVLWTGFPWGAGGYAQIDALGWLAPWVGVYGVGAVAAGLAAWLVLARGRARAVALVLALLLWAWPASGPWLTDRLPSLTQPAGELPVRLLQGAIAQDLKFDPGQGIPLALHWYGEQIERASQDPALAGGLLVAPETAVPLLPQEIDPDYWQTLGEHVRAGQVAVLFGVPLGSFEEGYTNSAVAWLPGTPAAEDDSGAGAFERLVAYRYDKHHLVPFGEFIPRGFRWFTELLRMPLGDFTRGALPQPPLVWRTQRIAPNICYEDLFGEELAAAFTDPAQAPTVLVNLSNIAWFGDTVAIDQHRHISRMRALELGRPMVRATNTGATAVIDHRGRVLAALPHGQRAVLDARVAARTGLTPYAALSAHAPLWPLAAGCAALLWLSCAWPRRRRAP